MPPSRYAHPGMVGVVAVREAEAAGRRKSAAEGVAAEEVVAALSLPLLEVAVAVAVAAP